MRRLTACVTAPLAVALALAAFGPKRRRKALPKAGDAGDEGRRHEKEAPSRKPPWSVSRLAGVAPSRGSPCSGLCTECRFRPAPAAAGVARCSHGRLDRSRPLTAVISISLSSRISVLPGSTAWRRRVVPTVRFRRVHRLPSRLGGSGPAPGAHANDPGDAPGPLTTNATERSSSGALFRLLLFLHLLERLGQKAGQGPHRHRTDDVAATVLFAHDSMRVRIR